MSKANLNFRKEELPSKEKELFKNRTVLKRIIFFVFLIVLINN
jgi:hypothetical protein